LKSKKEFFEKIGIQEPEIIERFENFIEKKSNDDIANVEVALNAFVNSERKLEVKNQFMIRGIQVIFTVCTSLSVGSIKFVIEDKELFLWLIPLYLINIVLTCFFLKSFFYKTSKYFTEDDIEKAKKE